MREYTGNSGKTVVGEGSESLCIVAAYFHNLLPTSIYVTNTKKILAQDNPNLMRHNLSKQYYPDHSFDVFSVSLYMVATHPLVWNNAPHLRAIVRGYMKCLLAPLRISRDARTLPLLLWVNCSWGHTSVCCFGRVDSNACCSQQLPSLMCDLSIATSTFQLYSVRIPGLCL